jgi:hypothetical protein
MEKNPSKLKPDVLNQQNILKCNANCNRLVFRFVLIWYLNVAHAEFEKLFKAMEVDGRLPRNKMVEFFEGASLFPTHKEVDGAFTATFTGRLNAG